MKRMKKCQDDHNSKHMGKHNPKHMGKHNLSRLSKAKATVCKNLPNLSWIKWLDIVDICCLKCWRAMSVSTSQACVLVSRMAIQWTTICMEFDDWSFATMRAIQHVSEIKVKWRINLTFKYNIELPKTEN